MARQGNPNQDPDQELEVQRETQEGNNCHWMVGHTQLNYQIDTSSKDGSNKREHKKFERGCFPVLNINDNQEPKTIRMLINLKPRKAKKSN